MAGLADQPAVVAAISADLTAAGVPHAVSGAVAMAAHGYVRATKDVDILVVVASVRLPEVFEIVRLRLWSPDESFNTLALVAAYAGDVPPAVEADFDLTRRANEAAGWVDYAWDLPARADAAGRVHVAFGISAVWETEMTYHVDDVEVCID